MPLVQAPPKTTAEQLLALDEPGFRHELVRGELRRMTGAGWWHGAVVSRVGKVLANHVDDRALGLTFGAETGFWLGKNPDTVRCPDAAFVRAERVPSAPGRGHFEGPPDLAVEVTSPNDRYGDVHEKVLAWLDAGARVVWVVDPMARCVTIHRVNVEPSVAHGDDVLDGGDVLPGFAVRVRELFPA